MTSSFPSYSLTTLGLKKPGQVPWGLALLIVGQFGLIGFILAFGSLLLPALYASRGQWNSAWRRPAAPLAIIGLMGVADALLNSFFLYPAILAAGALASDDGGTASFPFLKQKISLDPERFINVLTTRAL